MRTSELILYFVNKVSDPDLEKETRLHPGIVTPAAEVIVRTPEVPGVFSEELVSITQTHTLYTICFRCVCDCLEVCIQRILFTVLM